MNHDITKVELESGTQGLLIDVPGSSVVNIKINFRAGYQFGDFTKYEIPHLIEHHILNSTKHFPLNNQIMAEFSLNGAYINASTSPNFIGYIVECAEFEIDRILSLLKETITEPLFNKEYYDTERENVRSELTNYLNDYSRQLYILASEVSYPKLVLNYRTRLEQLDTISHEDVVSYYHETHTALNANFIIAGAVNEHREAILAGLNNLFSSLPKGHQKELWDGPGLGRSTPLIVEEKIDALNFKLGWFIPHGGSLSDRAGVNLLRGILTAGFTSRIYGKVRDLGLTYHLQSGGDWSLNGGSYSIGGFCNPLKWPDLIQLVGQELRILINDGVTVSELEAARKRSIGGMALSTQTVSSISSWYAGDYFKDGTIESYREYQDTLQAISTSEVSAMANQFFTVDEKITVLLGKVSIEDGILATNALNLS